MHFRTRYTWNSGRQKQNGNPVNPLSVAARDRAELTPRSLGHRAHRRPGTAAPARRELHLHLTRRPACGPKAGSSARCAESRQRPQAGPVPLTAAQRRAEAAHTAHPAGRAAAATAPRPHPSLLPLPAGPGSASRRSGRLPWMPGWLRGAAVGRGLSLPLIRVVHSKFEFYRSGASLVLTRGLPSLSVAPR